jgi:ADP-ribose pyrophosphatase YjhB (NUDIX family)
VNRLDQVLLFRADLMDRGALWYLPGGAVESGEGDETAIVRELMEETRLAVDPATLAPPVWTRDYIFRWHDTDERHLERFFLIRIGEHDVDTSGLDAEEAGITREFRWWTLADIAESDERFSPSRLAALLPPLIEGHIPDEPMALID